MAETFAFDRPGMTRAVAAIRKIEKMPDRPGGDGNDQTHYREGPQVRIGVAKTDITAFVAGTGGNPDTLGTGEMTVKKVIRSTSADNGDWSDSTITLNVHNPGGAIGTAQKMVAYLAGGVWIGRPLVGSATQYYNSANETTLGTTHHPNKFYPVLDSTPVDCGDFFVTGNTIGGVEVIKNTYDETMCLEFGYGMGMLFSPGTQTVAIFCQLEIWDAVPAFDSVVRGSIKGLSVVDAAASSASFGSCGVAGLTVELAAGYSVRLACIMDSGATSAEWNAYSIPIDHAMLSARTIP